MPRHATPRSKEAAQPGRRRKRREQVPRAREGRQASSQSPAFPDAAPFHPTPGLATKRPSLPGLEAADAPFIGPDGGGLRRRGGRTQWIRVAGGWWVVPVHHPSGKGGDAGLRSGPGALGAANRGGGGGQLQGPSRVGRLPLPARRRRAAAAAATPPPGPPLNFRCERRESGLEPEELRRAAAKLAARAASHLAEDPCRAVAFPGCPSHPAPIDWGPDRLQNTRNAARRRCFSCCGRYAGVAAVTGEKKRAPAARRTPSGSAKGLLLQLTLFPRWRNEAAAGWGGMSSPFPRFPSLQSCP